MKKILFFLSIGLFASLALSAQNDKGVSFEYDVRSHTYFDNRENDNTVAQYTPSMTLFAQALTPQVGIAVRGGSDITHRFRLGLDATAYFGSPQKPYGRIDKILAYYRLEKKFSNGGTFQAIGGIFPKTYYKGSYTRAFVSDSARFVSRNCQGLLFSYETKKFRAELIGYWLGMKQGTTRERFQIWSAAQYDFFPWMALGYAFSFDHTACSDVVFNVIDNHLLRPYMAFDLSSLVPMQRLFVDVGGYVGYQRDRATKATYIPGGVELNAEIRHWNVGVRNSLYLGINLEPLFYKQDPHGKAYGGSIYISDHYYQVRKDGSANSTWLPYNRLELFYEPYLCRGVSLNVSLVFHFNGGLSGTQQIIGLKADLSEILKNFKK